MKVVLDTNVIVSALLNPEGAPAAVVDLILAGGLEVAFDDRVIEEYREVLLRPRFGFDPAVVEKVVQAIEAGERVEAPLLGLEPSGCR